MLAKALSVVGTVTLGSGARTHPAYTFPGLGSLPLNLSNKKVFVDMWKLLPEAWRTETQTADQKPTVGTNNPFQALG